MYSCMCVYIYIYEETTRLAETRPAQTTLNYISMAYTTLNCLNCPGILSYAKVV